MGFKAYVRVKVGSGLGITSELWIKQMSVSHNWTNGFGNTVLRHMYLCNISFL